jgi:hypothetical protein
VDQELDMAVREDVESKQGWGRPMVLLLDLRNLAVVEDGVLVIWYDNVDKLYNVLLKLTHSTL